MFGHATVAQLVEQLIRNQQVAGSSPASSSMKKALFVYRTKALVSVIFACGEFYCAAVIFVLRTSYIALRAV